MMFKKHFIKTICITLMLTFLTISVGKVTCASGMAAPQLLPVYDTEIIDLKNYVQTLPAPKLDVFYFLAGALVSAQAGTAQNRLVNPYTDPEDVKQFFIGLGIGIYNSIIGFVEGPNQYGIDVGPITKALVATLMGDAVVAANVPDLDSFLQNNSSYYMPFNADVQQGINFLFAVDNGIYNWQISESDWPDQFVWRHDEYSDVVMSQYHAAVAQLSTPKYFASFCPVNQTIGGYDYINLVFSGLTDKYDLFIDTDDHTIQFYNAPSYSSVDVVGIYTYNLSIYTTEQQIIFPTITYDPANYDTYSDIVNYYFSCINEVGNSIYLLCYFRDGNGLYCVPRYNDILKDVYYGNTWDNRVILNNTTDLNIADDSALYYEQMQTEYLLDIIGIFNDLLNETDLRSPVYNNIFDPTTLDPVLIPLTNLYNVAFNIEQFLDQINPPLPVDLNDIAELTENSYLERVKEHARNFGDIFVNYIFFWHNCDADIVYTFFGAGIMVLIGAFIGKWGHS